MATGWGGVLMYAGLSSAPSESNEMVAIQRSHKNGCVQNWPGGRKIWTIIPKFSAPGPPRVTDTPLGWMRMVMIGWRERFQWIQIKMWKRQKWNLAAPIAILFVSEKMGRGSWRLHRQIKCFIILRYPLLRPTQWFDWAGGQREYSQGARH